MVGVAAMASAAVIPAPAAQASPSPDCPPTVDCRFVPAAYDWASSDHSDPNNYGNYDRANRPADGDQIRYIVIHDTEESYTDTIKSFQDPSHFASANYVIRNSDGQITQMVPNKDVPWSVGNWSMNQHSINIEHEGYGQQGNYSEAMYESSAKLVRYLAAKYHIPLDRQHIIAHEDVAGETDQKQASQHWDPGPYWNWQHYMSLLGIPPAKRDGAPRPGETVAIEPNFASNRPPVTGTNGEQLPKRGANFVYLRTAPSSSAPLIGDPLVHSGAGTTAIDDWSDTAVTGHEYVVADQHGDWTAIWFDGQKAWFLNPGGVNTRKTLARTITARKTVPVYGRAFPDKAAYQAAGVPYDPSDAPKPLSWTIPAGQSYTVVEPMQASDYYARFDGAHLRVNHVLVQSPEQYLLVDYNHRYAWVKASDLL